MHFRSIALAFLLSAFAGVVVAATAMPPSAMLDKSKSLEAGYRKPVDCHRSVRTHRIFGRMVRHRHVGDDCAVREVKKLNSF
jgi:hypothetical protein